MRPRTLAATSAAATAAAVAGSIPTDPDAAWFRRLDLPPFYPPSSAFPIVWSVLYADIAVATAAAHDATEDEAERRALRRSLAINLGLNAAWSWIFWRARRPGLAALEALVLAISSAGLVRRVARSRPGAAFALSPYVVWCAFAAALSAAIAYRNPHLPAAR